MHYLSVILQIQMQVFKKWLNKQNYDLTAAFMYNLCKTFTMIRISEIK